jgi:hypothetical protein
MHPDNRYNRGKTLGELLRARLVLVAVCRRCKHEHVLYPALLIEAPGSGALEAVAPERVGADLVVADVGDRPRRPSLLQPHEAPVHKGDLALAVLAVAHHGATWRGKIAFTGSKATVRLCDARKKRPM